ncbi:FAD binding domain-containing protein [Mycolicibacterium mageritense]|uniref:6-hydroxypseudooxynicotine dehydrogenase complex subunit alpha n=1 Tax=Mycolicibacterium mageritense TaxID=53462 RepID=A0AAI8TQG8_MYCME|nr:xanthine dehydrogenase family protein subunit M [Mycolicibacterium mageritense]TXI63605.1 MAG: xanthine dehydrogenase family protein subunit M [Mycolicibacterium mageritense]BDY26675.1 6-hydroxypseudooxynicotine dehydrogenase complex subunit alpha [Mycolicibacterium mageritense]
MKPPPFAFKRAASVDEAVALLAEAGDEAKLIAGGQSLVPLLAFRLARPSHLIDISSVATARGLHREDGALRIGALTRHRDLETSNGLTGCHRALREAAAHIGHLPIRSVGTLGGSIAHADPAAELPTTLIALNARIIMRSLSGERTMAGEDFFTGPFMTELEPDEMVVGVDVPDAAGVTSAFEEIRYRSGDFAIAATAVALGSDSTGRVIEPRIALAGVGPCPARAQTAEQSLVGRFLEPAVIAEAARAAADDCDPPTDNHASAAYRRELVAVTVGRALHRLAAEVDR